MRALLAADTAVLRFARTHGHRPELERSVARFSALGEHGALWLALGAAGAVRAGRHTRPAPGVASDRAGWRRAIAVVLGVYALNTAVKAVVGRPRPDLPGLPPLVGTPTGLSFPSAHASTAFAAAHAYSRLGWPAPALHALAAALASSRLYLGVHYPSDLLAGALLGRLLSGAAASWVRS